MRLEQLERSKVTTADQAPSIEVEGRIIPTDSEGYLLDPADWSPALTEALAARDGVTLERDHWILIDFLHRFYTEFEIAPEMPILSRNLCKDQKNCRWTRTYINKLFPQGAKTACRYAGLPAPVGRSCL
jgi:tRNA 2-thiouridine synthesizing protein E